MASNTLDDRDRLILERLHRGEADVESLAGTANTSSEDLRERLPKLADNRLVERVDDDTYALTEDGQRVVAASPAGTQDDRINTPDAVESELAAFDLRADREEAVRNAFAFLHYWGAATESEIIDAIYSEDPAEYDSSEAWWNELVRDRLAALPSVEASESAGEPWRYDGTPIVEEHSADGRLLLGPAATEQASAKFALERLPVADAEREAVRGAFELLQREGEASADEFRKRVFPDHDAGFESAVEWWNVVREQFVLLPGVEQTDADGERWKYREADEDNT